MEKENGYMQHTSMLYTSTQNNSMSLKMNWKKIWLLYWKRVWQVLILTVFAAALGAGMYRATEALTSEGQFYRVSSDYYITFNFDEYETSVDYYNAYTWDSILRDDPIVDEALAILPDDYTKDEIKASITGEMLGDYRILTVHSTHKKPERAEAIALAYTESLALFGDKIEMLDAVEIWSREECMPVVEKDLTANAAILGAIIGLVLAWILGAVHYVLDDSIYVESDFRERFNLPFLGTMTRKESALCKQELKDNLSYLLKEGEGYYLVTVSPGKEVSADVLEKVKGLHSGILGSLSLQGEDLAVLRKSKGALLLIPWGSNNGRIVEKTIQFLGKQNCIIAGAILYDADDEFLQKYYNTREDR